MAVFLLIHGAMSIPIRDASTIIAIDHRFVVMRSVGNASRRIGKQLIQRTGSPTLSFAFKSRSNFVNAQPHEWTLVTLARKLAPGTSCRQIRLAGEVPCFFSSESRCTKQGRPPMTECFLRARHPGCRG